MNLKKLINNIRNGNIRCITWFVILYLLKLSNAQSQCNIPSADVLQGGYAIYSCRAFELSDPVLAIRSIRPLPLRYTDPANHACNFVDNAPYAPSIRTWSANDFGGNQIMGVAFDHRNGEIYAATTLFYNSLDAFTGTTLSLVFRISADGNVIENFATLPGNKGTGWMDIDTLNNQLYVSNMDDGQIYAIPLSNGTNQTGPFVTFSPFPADMINESTVATAPDWNMAQLGERILGVGFNPVESRLYYSVWVTDLIGNPSQQNVIRSVQISPTGMFLTATDVLEVTLPFLPYQNQNGLPYSMPVTDIVFSNDGTRMLLAEQGFDSSIGAGGVAHNSNLYEYTGVTSAWVAEPINKFELGKFTHDTRGGVSFAPGGYTSSGSTILNEDFVIATADAVADNYIYPLGGPPSGITAYYVDGAAFISSEGSYSKCNLLGLDLDQVNINPNKASFGDVDVRVCNNVLPIYDLALQKTLNTAANPGPFQIGDQVTFQIKVYNQGTEPVTNVTLTDMFPSELVLNDADWTLSGIGQAQYILSSLAPSTFTTIDITFTINAGASEIKNYTEVTELRDILGVLVSDGDSDQDIGAGNDPNEIVNDIYGTEPNEDHDDLDFATFWIGTVGVGNLVFIEGNADKVFNSGEGLDGITVECYRPGFGPDGISGNVDDYTPVLTTTTMNGGEYSFTGLRPGNYIVSIPYNMFTLGGPLNKFAPISGDGLDDQVDDNLDENTRDPNNINVMPLDIAGANSVLIGLYPSTEPTGEVGFNGSGDSPDEDVDYTVDFGFFRPVGIGNLVWMDFNDNDQFDIGEGVGNATMELYRYGYGPDGIEETSDDNDPVATYITDSEGTYRFLNLPQGNYVVKMPVFQFNTLGIGLLYKARNIFGNDGDSGIDDDVSENTIDSLEPFFDGASSDTIRLRYDTEPINESGFDGNADHPDEDIDFTIDFGFKPLVGIGNLVWIDNDNNNIYSPNEGINGVLMELYKPGYGPDNIAGNADDDQVVQTTYTFNGGNGDGTYLFGDYPGTYIVKIPASQFQLGGPLFAYTSLSGNGSDNQQDDNEDENGVNVGLPNVDGVESVPITLSVNGEILNEPGFPFFTGPFDGNIDFTIDFGFTLGCTLMATCTSQPQTICIPNDGSAATMVSGTRGNISYLWSSGETTSSISNKASGTYTVTVTDDGVAECSMTCEAVIANNASAPTCAITVNTQPSCANFTGGNITVVPSPAGAYTYAWSDNGAATATRSGLTGGTYTVTVTNTTSNCTGVCNVTLTTPTNCCNINAITAINLECIDNGTPANITDNRIRFSANVTNTNTSLTGYNVTINGGTTITPNTNVSYGVTTFTLGTGTAGGGATFTVTVTDSATPGCTQTFIVTDPGNCAPVLPECPPVKCGTATIQVNGN